MWKWLVLEVAREVYSVKGVEYSDTIRQWLEENLSIPSVKSLDDIDEEFDVITAFDLIEHVPDPLNTLTAMGKLLRKDGVILIFTPNKDSLSFHITGEKNNLICPPQHLFYFNKNSFEYLANIAGLEIVFLKLGVPILVTLKVFMSVGLISRNGASSSQNLCKM